jgi:hypothetical protein
MQILRTDGFLLTLAYILWHVRSKPDVWSQRRRPLLGSGSVNKFPRQPNYVTAATDTHATIEELLEAVFSVGSMERLHKESQLGA